jgi:dinuclear metal center YbgI/SA1388 family protein
MKKATIGHIAGFLNTILRIRKIKDVSVNGLQSRGRNRGTIKTVGFAVDACIATFEKARRRNVNLLVVHHGITWKPQKDRVLADTRTAYLGKNNMALYAAHLPLDSHEEYGNNMQLARLLDVQRPHKFGRYHGIKIGYAGSFRKAVSLDFIATQLNIHLKTPCQVYRFGNRRVRSIGIVSGDGGDMLRDAVKEGLDCFLVGEIDLTVHNAARDHGINVIAAGHYATETVGVKALMPLIRKAYHVKTVFIADPKKL